MSAGKFRMGLNLRKPSEKEQQSAGGQQKVPIAAKNVFGDADDEGESEGESAAQKFERKYAASANTKAREQRLVEKEMAAHPDIYDYDTHYEQMQEQRDRKVADQREADKEKKPKYAHLIAKAHKQRELNRLLVEENSYKKEREREAGEFEDKDVFVTGAYRQQIEERQRHREEMAKEEALEKLRDVRGQQMWQQAFNRTMLDQISRDYVEEKTETEMEEERSGGGGGKGKEVKKEEAAEEEEGMKMEVEETETAAAEGETKGKGISTTTDTVKQEEPSSTHRHHHHHHQRRERSEHEEGRDGRGRRTSSPAAEAEDGGDPKRKRRRSGTMEKEEKDGGKGGGRKEGREGGRGRTADAEGTDGRRKDAREEERDEQAARMARIRELLKRRNDAHAVEEARKRYEERRAGGDIVAPV